MRETHSSFVQKMVYFFFGILLISSLSCYKKDDSYLHWSGNGMRPLYVQGDAFYNIKNLPPQSIVQSGSIYLRDTFLFIVDQGKGVHIFDVADPANPVGLTFISIPAISGFTLTGHFMYADSWMDLVTIDISDLFNVVVLDRQKNVFEPYLFPPDYSGIFECVNPERGAVVGWEEVYLEKVNCRTNQ